MLADVSHQLRTPLTALRLRVELLAADPATADSGEFDGALDELGRPARMVDGLLAVARAENVTESPEPIGPRCGDRSPPIGTPTCRWSRISRSRLWLSPPTSSR
jgi:signal transduction histidine kinase